MANLQSIVRKNKLAEFFYHGEWVLYLFLGCLTPLVFFTFSGNILMTYLLPCMPAFALLTVYSIQFNLNSLNESKWFTSTKGFVSFALVVPVSLDIFTILPQVGLHYSHKLIGQAFNKKALGASRLIYTRTMPISASFYSDGAAYPMHKDMDKDEMLRYIHDGSVDYYVVRSDDEASFIKQFSPMVSKVRVFDKFVVFKDNL